jgi:dTDP-4-dehydrorhamnose 3,5-epimerase
MKLYQQKIEGVFLIVPKPFTDHRGVFRRHFCNQELKKKGVIFRVKQSNISENFSRGTLRGFHFQKKPFSEDKLISCLKGGVYDVIVDLRPNSKTFKKWLAFKLNDKNRHSLLIPKGCANAFLTLKDNTILHYYCSEAYNPNYEGGVRYNDPTFVFKWPAKVNIISKKDLNFEDFIN